METNEKPVTCGVVLTSTELAAVMALLSEMIPQWEACIPAFANDQLRREGAHDCLKGARSAYQKFYRASFGKNP